MTNPDVRAATIAALNDALRRSLLDRRLGRTYLTDGIEGLGPETAARIIAAVSAFDAFTADNDPYGEHDFGSLEVDGHRVFFKIDYYSRSDPDCGAEDPSDAATTERALTIMLAEEY